MSPFKILSSCFHLLRFPSIIPVVTKCSNFSLITWLRKFAWRLDILSVSHVVVSASRISFDFFAVQEIVAFSVGIAFLLPPVSLVAILKLYRPRIRTPGWVQYSTPRLFFLCDSRCIYSLETLFHCTF